MLNRTLSGLALFAIGTLIAGTVMFGPAQIRVSRGLSTFLPTPTGHKGAASPTPTRPAPTPTATHIPMFPPLAWPLRPATDQQIAEARACDLKGLATSRYPANVSMGELRSAYEPTSACDWGALAVAYTVRLKQGETAPEVGREAFKQAIAQNSALAFTLPMLSSYFSSSNVVEVPPFARQPIVRAEISHSFFGLGPAIAYSFTIDQADTNRPTIAGQSKYDLEETTLSGPLDKALVQALAASLTDLVPMRSQFTQQVCTDDYPDWVVSLTFKDGTIVKMVTNKSNIYFSGGPWQTEIDGQNYMQYSPRFLLALLKISEALKLPKDNTAAMYCHGLKEDPLTQAFGGTGTAQATQVATKKAGR